MPQSYDHVAIQFLFRKQGDKNFSTAPSGSTTHYPLLLSYIARLFRSKRQRIQSTQWTNKLASLVDSHPVQTTHSPPYPNSGHDLQSPVSLITSKTEAPSKTSIFPKINVSLRLEGPYFSPAEPFHHDTVICLVAGTGVSGAIAIARAFIEMQNSRGAATTALMDPSAPSKQAGGDYFPNCKRCIVVWSVREEDYVDLPFFQSKLIGFLIFILSLGT